MTAPALRPDHGYVPASKWISRPVPGLPCIAEARRSSRKFRVRFSLEKDAPPLSIEFTVDGKVQSVSVEESVPLWRLSLLLSAARYVVAGGGADWVRELPSAHIPKETLS